MYKNIQKYYREYKHITKNIKIYKNIQIIYKNIQIIYKNNITKIYQYIQKYT